MARLATLLAANAARRRADRRDAALAPALLRVRAWQARRLAHSYADLAGEPRYQAAVAFFLGELYGGAEPGPRDRDLARAAGALERLLPAAALEAVRQAIALELASQQLDARLARALPAGAPLTAEGYARAYRASAPRAERAAQLEAILALGATLDGLVRRPGLALLLRLTHAPASAAGLGALQGFLERGYAAFHATGGAQEFLATIRARESQWLDGLYRDPPVSADRRRA